MKKFNLLILLSVFIFAGCSEKEGAVIEEQKLEFSMSELNSNIELMGQAVALAFNQSPDLRELFYREALLQTTYDYDVPLTFVENEVVDGMTVKELISANLLKVAPDKDYEKIMAGLRYLQLTLPMHQLESWNTNDKPAIAVYPVGKNRREIESFNAYTSDGQTISLCANDLPEIPVVVLRESDRITSDGFLTVNESGMGIEPESRLKMAEVREMQRTVLKSGSSYLDVPQFLQIVTEEEMKEYLEKGTQEFAEIKEYNQGMIEKASLLNEKLKSTSRFKLRSFTNQPRVLTLTWDGVDETGVNYDIVVSGRFKSFITSLGTHKNDVVVATTQNRSTSITLDFPYKVYNVMIRTRQSDGVIRESNYVSTHTSDRAEGCTEFPTYVRMTASFIRSVEGWAASKVEPYSVVSITDGEGKANSYKKVVKFTPQYNWLGRMQDTQRYYGYNQWNLFEWKRLQWEDELGRWSNNGAYVIHWFEEDLDRKSVNRNLYTNAVKLLPQGGIATLVESIFHVATGAQYSKDAGDEEMGTSEISWWTPSGYVSNPASGFSVTHSFKNH